MNRRDFLRYAAASSAAALSGLSACSNKTNTPIAGEFVGPNMALGHRLRHADFPAFSRTQHCQVAIIGGGISGLSAGWYLQRQGMHDYKIFELENTAGGNARSGKNAVSAYPWGAHYLPIPNADAHLLKSFLAECGAITANPESDKPTYNPRYLCFAPEERLFIHGVWQEGLIPQIGISAKEKSELARFHQLMAQYQIAFDKRGKKAFHIPTRLSATDAEWLVLDSISIKQWLLQQGLTSPALHWYVNYGCRDDYGAHYSQISAWAGIHYFAGRSGLASNAETDQVLTWPQGNAWLVEQLSKNQYSHIHTGQMAISLLPEKHHIALDIFDATQQTTTRWLAKQVIYAAPLHTLAHVLRQPNTALVQASSQVPHAPWLVANLTVAQENADWANYHGGLNSGLAWDNVIYNSHSLGYVAACHQSIAQHQAQNVLTYYRPFAEITPAQARKRLFEQPWQNWVTEIVRDLQTAHPNIDSAISRIDIMRWAHAMTYPYVGFLQLQARQLLNQAHDRLHIAHTDAAGISIFEEAFDQGTQAAMRTLL